MSTDQDGGLLCPSAQPDMQGAVVIGVLYPTESARQIAYLNRAVGIDRKAAQLASDVLKSSLA